MGNGSTTVYSVLCGKCQGTKDSDGRLRPVWAYFPKNCPDDLPLPLVNIPREMPLFIHMFRERQGPE